MRHHPSLPAALLAIALMLTALTTSCGRGGEDYGPDVTTPEEPTPIPNKGPLPPETFLTCPTGTQLTYSNFGAAFMQSYCTSCHSQTLPEGQRGGAPLAANLDTAAGVNLLRAGIQARTAIDNPPMPPSGFVGSNDREFLKEWLGCGAP